MVIIEGQVLGTDRKQGSFVGSEGKPVVYDYMIVHLLEETDVRHCRIDRDVAFQLPVRGETLRARATLSAQRRGSDAEVIVRLVERLVLVDGARAE